MALQRFSFKTEHIEEAMKNTLLYGGDLHSALDWLCLNLPNDALPEGFSQQFEEQQQKPRAKFCSAVSQCGMPPHLEDNKKKENGPGTKEMNVRKEKELTMKEWILRYAEQQSDEEKDEPVKETDEEKFDPNERYMHLSAKLSEAKEQASISKQDKDKQGQKAAQEKIRRIQQEMAALEEHPVFNPAIKISNQQQNEKKKTPSPQPQETTLNLSLLEKPDAKEDKGAAKEDKGVLGAARRREERKKNRKRPQEPSGEQGEEPAGPLQKTPIILAKPPAERVSLGGVATNQGGVATNQGGVATNQGGQPPPSAPKAGPAQAPPPPAPAPPIVLMKARGEEGRGGGGASVAAGEGPAQAPPTEREGPRPTQPVYQLHSRGLAPPAALDLGVSPPAPPPAAQAQARLAAPEKMKSSIKLVDEQMNWCDSALEFLLEQTDVLVVGALGLQGTGKSTVMSLLAGNQPEEDPR
ncbi:protein SMG9, partial [Onychostruthus taczanowskii]|uniref:protein SMG9 n=1 Tax=Onychostruthus taczanowskii TaxID=356909 RepID=UPI001B7FFFED